MQSSLTLFLCLCLYLCSTLALSEKKTVLVFRNGGNNTIDDWSVTVYPEDFSGLWELADYAAYHLKLLPDLCSVFSPYHTQQLKEPCQRFYFDVFNHYGEQIFSLTDIVHGDWLYIVPVTDHWVWPGHYVGRKVLLRQLSAEVGRPMFIETINLTPRIFQVKDWFSNEESEKIISIAENYLEPSYMVKKERGTYYEEGRNSYQAWLKKEYDEIVVKTDERLGRFAHIPVELELEEQLQILRYFPNQHYFTHHDYFDRDPPKECNRFLTLLFYLTDVEAGGHTAFPLANNQPYEALTFNQEDCTRGIAIKPIRNALVLFYNLLPDSHMKGTPDPQTLHLGCDVIEGVKWAGNKWIHNKACD